MMSLDFSKIKAAATVDTVANPREIFAVLPNKAKKYSYLRDVQAEVLSQWFERRNTANLRLKMNTGGGKTVVGLLILKSCLNENKGPAVYVAPTPYLATQVAREAESLGLEVETDPRASSVARGRSILITNVHVLINGMSKFGVGSQGQVIQIGSLILDDAHACLATAEQQFTVQFEADHDAYKALFELFRGDLEQQSATAVLDLEQQDPTRQAIVPFWAWHDRIARVNEIIHPFRDEDFLKFKWPLVRDHLHQCRCVFGGGDIEISPRCLPVDVIPSFARARRRVFMSATFSDDSVLITHFNAAPDEIKNAIAPESASDIGDRMILVPQELTPEITDDEIRAFVNRRSKKHNVVVIVPSYFRAESWRDSADMVLSAENLDEGVRQLNAGHVGLVVIVNKYDGIDLPHDACRILVLDGVPMARRMIDQIEQGSLLMGTSLSLGKAVQQIEQGMGRGVRANDDYCVVLLMGRSLTAQLFTANGIERLTPATRAQFDLSEQVGNQVRGKNIEEIAGAIDYCLDRNADWVRAAKSALVHVKYDTGSTDLAIAVARREAFNAAEVNDWSGAADVLQRCVNGIGDPIVKGWMMVELAECVHMIDKVESQQIIMSALKLNKQVVRPLGGISYQRLDPRTGEQASASLNYVRGRFARPNDLIMSANAAADDLAFRPKSYRRFHAALHEVALLLGFGSQLPEAEFGAGPDVLWAVGDLRYWIIECKNEAVADTITKSYANQLAGSVNWFAKRYDQTCESVPVMVHPSSEFDRAATAPSGTRIITREKLDELREAFRKYCVALATYHGVGEVKDVAKLLRVYGLLPDLLLERYTISV